VVLRLRLTPDCDRATRQAAMARVALEQVERDVRTLETQTQTWSTTDPAPALHRLGAARQRRFALATAWHENAAAEQSCHPADRRIADALALAEDSRARYAVPMGAMN
jgi:hypothetical protein